MKKVLVIGGGGFIGGFIANEGLKRGLEVWVAVRRSTSMRYLNDPRLHTLILDYDDPAQVTQALVEALPQGERWDYVIHNLGATKCTRFTEFNHINYEYLRTVVEALKAADKVPDKFLLMSSLSAIGPGDERHYTPLTGDTVPNPNTWYGVSKIKAEQYMQYRSGIPYVIFRATGVYGPHEQDYLMMIKSIDSHWDFGVGFRKQLLTFIYVDDLVGAMYDALASDVTTGRSYIISEPTAYTQRQFRSMVAKALGRHVVIPLKLPMWIVYIASAIAEKIGVLRGKPSTLNRDKYKIMKQRNWNCDVTPARRDFDFTVNYPLQRGIEETVKAYKEQKASAGQK
ncbi:MAG: NAD(P)-dependent oxidoreductase [Clostridiales bacterium]|nr:NAD(P)-dependent oxidoreductase [Clostridiales bacterium]